MKIKTLLLISAMLVLSGSLRAEEILSARKLSFQGYEVNYSTYSKDKITVEESFLEEYSKNKKQNRIIGGSIEIIISPILGILSHPASGDYGTYGITSTFLISGLINLTTPSNAEIEYNKIRLIDNQQNKELALHKSFSNLAGAPRL